MIDTIKNLEMYFAKKISFEDLELIRDRTIRLAERLTLARHATFPTPFGTDTTMDLDDRSGVPLHPLHDAAVSMIPDYAEAAISPIEGTSEGIIVVDAAVQEWGYILRQPLNITVKKGRVEKGR
jgi:leucyl aminopeptidase (aminopeptidase T)